MANYTSIGINGRPINNMSLPITVSFGLGLIQMDLNEKDKILTTSMWSLYVSTKFSQLSFSCFANIHVWVSMFYVFVFVLVFKGQLTYISLRV